ncbi:hypothetical protein CC78DRAFT_605472 [Lojkania enalia]|uniref:Uncharacterized protein n=1 Tax=Lojkania enalia TaxID=147567 RepID=A0A9P4N9K6_9PLEO|nr:hypothetical protein CC78DRAFT_605472 [Didymosphaeria enalia]
MFVAPSSKPPLGLSSSSKQTGGPCLFVPFARFNRAQQPQSIGVVTDHSNELCDRYSPFLASISRPASKLMPNLGTIGALLLLFASLAALASTAPTSGPSNNLSVLSDSNCHSTLFTGGQVQVGDSSLCRFFSTDDCTGEVEAVAAGPQVDALHSISVGVVNSYFCTPHVELDISVYGKFLHRALGNANVHTRDGAEPSSAGSDILLESKDRKIRLASATTLIAQSPGTVLACSQHDLRENCVIENALNKCRAFDPKVRGKMKSLLQWKGVHCRYYTTDECVNQSTKTLDSLRGDLYWPTLGVYEWWFRSVDCLVPGPAPPQPNARDLNTLNMSAITTVLRIVDAQGLGLLGKTSDGSGLPDLPAMPLGTVLVCQKKGWEVSGCFIVNALDVCAWWNKGLWGWIQWPGVICQWSKRTDCKTNDWQIDTREGYAFWDVRDRPNADYNGVTCFAENKNKARSLDNASKSYRIAPDGHAGRVHIAHDKLHISDISAALPVPDRLQAKNGNSNNDQGVQKCTSPDYVDCPPGKILACMDAEWKSCRIFDTVGGICQNLWGPQTVWGIDVLQGGIRCEFYMLPDCKEDSNNRLMYANFEQKDRASFHVPDSSVKYPWTSIACGLLDKPTQRGDGSEVNAESFQERSLGTRGTDNIEIAEAGLSIAASSVHIISETLQISSITQIPKLYPDEITKAQNGDVDPTDRCTAPYFMGCDPGTIAACRLPGWKECGVFNALERCSQFPYGKFWGAYYLGSGVGCSWYFLPNCEEDSDSTAWFETVESNRGINGTEQDKLPYIGVTCSMLPKRTRTDGLVEEKRCEINPKDSQEASLVGKRRVNITSKTLEISTATSVPDLVLDISGSRSDWLGLDIKSCKAPNFLECPSGKMISCQEPGWKKCVIFDTLKRCYNFGSPSWGLQILAGGIGCNVYRQPDCKDEKPEYGDFPYPGRTAFSASEGKAFFWGSIACGELPEDLDHRNLDIDIRAFEHPSAGHARGVEIPTKLKQVPSFKQSRHVGNEPKPVPISSVDVFGIRREWIPGQSAGSVMTCYENNWQNCEIADVMNRCRNYNPRTIWGWLVWGPVACYWYFEKGCKETPDRKTYYFEAVEGAMMSARSSSMRFLFASLACARLNGHAVQGSRERDYVTETEALPLQKRDLIVYPEAPNLDIGQVNTPDTEIVPRTEKSSSADIPPPLDWLNCKGIPSWGCQPGTVIACYSPNWDDCEIGQAMEQCLGIRNLVWGVLVRGPSACNFHSQSNCKTDPNHEPIHHNELGTGYWTHVDDPNKRFTLRSVACGKLPGLAEQTDFNIPSKYVVNLQLDALQVGIEAKEPAEPVPDTLSTTLSFKKVEVPPEPLVPDVDQIDWPPRLPPGLVGFCYEPDWKDCYHGYTMENCQNIPKGFWSWWFYGSAGCSFFNLRDCKTDPEHEVWHYDQLSSESVWLTGRWPEEQFPILSIACGRLGVHLAEGADPGSHPRTWKKAASGKLELLPSEERKLFQGVEAPQFNARQVDSEAKGPVEGIDDPSTTESSFMDVPQPNDGKARKVPTRIGPGTVMMCAGMEYSGCQPFNAFEQCVIFPANYGASLAVLANSECSFWFKPDGKPWSDEPDLVIKTDAEHTALPKLEDKHMKKLRAAYCTPKSSE